MFDTGLRYDSIQKIILLDSYNDNYERVWGREYQIEIDSMDIQIFQTEEYYHSYQFDFNSIDYDSLKLLKSRGISKSRAKKLTKQVNNQIDRKIAFKEKLDSIVWGTSSKPENWKGKRKIGSINKELLENLVNTINSKKISPYNYLRDTGIDSAWLQSNSKRLFENWLKLHPNAKEQSKSNISEALKDYNLFKKAFFHYITPGNFTHYPFFEISFITKSNDTIRLESRGQGQYQVPWTLNDKKNYNPKLSILISNLIPDQQFYSVKSRLDPDWSQTEEGILNAFERVQNMYESKK